MDSCGETSNYALQRCVHAFELARVLRAGHVRAGRAHLNFSDWPQGRPWEARAKLESAAHLLRADAMPPSDYRLLYPAAKVTSNERLRLVTWLETNAASLQSQRAPGE